MQKRGQRDHVGRPYLRMRSEIFAKGLPCYLCSHPIDYNLDWRDPGAPQLHLILPLAKGGSWRDPNNCRAAHRLCNSRQGDQLDGAVDHSQNWSEQSQWITCEEP